MSPSAVDLPAWSPANTEVLRLTIWGLPIPMGRPRVVGRGGRPRALTPERTTAYRNDVRAAWSAAGSPRLGPGLLAIEFAFLFSHPPTHYRKDGRLNAIGLAATPGGTADLTNLEKNVEDALKGLAFEDDRFICWKASGKDWAKQPHTTVLAWVIDRDDPWRPQ